MTTALVVAGALLIGLPVIAVLLARLPAWDRLEPGTAAGFDPWPVVRDLHRLDPHEMQRVQFVVGRQSVWPTRPPEDERLRSAAVDWFRVELARVQRPVRGPFGPVVRLVEAPTRWWVRRTILRFGGDPTPLRPPIG